MNIVIFIFMIVSILANILLYIIRKKGKDPMSRIKTDDLIELIPDKYTREEIRSEISLRLYNCESEKETQKLWKRFTELN